MMPLIKFILLFFLAIVVSSSSDFNRKKGASQSFFSSSSAFSSFSSNGGKPETHTRSMKTEEYYDKEDGKNPEIRKYGEMFAKDNDKPALVKENASTNVESEEMLLGGGKTAEMKILDPDEEKKYLGGFDRSFDNFFKTEDINPMSDMMPPLKNIFGHLTSMLPVRHPELDFPLEESKKLEKEGETKGEKEYGNYSKYLKKKERELINKRLK